MSKTWTRKVHQGQVKKRENEIERQKEEENRKEAEEAARWVGEPKGPSGYEVKMERLKEREDKKKKLKELYEEEMLEKK